MLGPVTCQACGAKVREDRVRCLRCGAPLAPPARPSSASQPTPEGAGARPTLSRPSIFAIAAIVALGGFAYLMSGGDVGERAPVAPDSAAQARAEAPGPARPAPGVSAAPAAPRAPEPVVAAMDASRGGIAAYNSGNLSGSVQQFEAAVAAAPDNADALNNLGQVLVRAGRAREAIPYFDRAIALANSVWAYHFNRARAYAELQEWNRAVAGYREAARLFPDDYVTAFNLARALQADGRLSEAIEEYQRAVALAPGEPDFLLSLAHALETAQRPADALAAYRQYLELDEASPAAEKIKARIAQIEGQS